MPKLSEHGSKLQWGQFLLEITHSATDVRALVRTIDGQEGHVSKRMLQRIDRPWGLPQNINIGAEGISIRMAVVTADIESQPAQTVIQKGELVLVLGQPILDDLNVIALIVEVRDFEGRTGYISRDCLDFRYSKPWGLLVKEDRWETRMAGMKRGGEKTPPYQKAFSRNGMKRPWEL